MYFFTFTQSILIDYFEATGSCMRRTCEAHTLSTIPEIGKCIFFSGKAVILTSLWHFVHKATSKTSEKLAKSF